MASLTYHTQGIILAHHDVREVDRLFRVYTEDFGQISLFAKGIRKQTSKLSPHLTLFSRSRISFVQGKDLRRLIDAEQEKQFSLLSDDHFVVAGNISRLLFRMIHGEEPNAHIWQMLGDFFAFLEHDAQITRSDRRFLYAAELIVSARLLYHLGYVDEAHLPEVCRSGEAFFHAVSHLARNSAATQKTSSVVQAGMEASQL